MVGKKTVTKIGQWLEINDTLRYLDLEGNTFTTNGEDYEAME